MLPSGGGIHQVFFLKGGVLMLVSQVVRDVVRASLAVVGALAVAATVTGCQPKQTTQMNSCSCACRQETETTVTIANKNFYSNAECGSFEGADCNVNVKKRDGAVYTVSGKWEGCQSNGKANVSVLSTPDEIPTVAVAPDDVVQPPPPPRQ